MKKAMANVAYISILISLLVGAIVYFSSGAVLRLLRTPDEIMQDVLIYMPHAVYWSSIDCSIIMLLIHCLYEKDLMVSW